MNKPLLPDYLKLEPYLKRIDENRYYSNHGEMVTEFETWLGHLFEAPCVTASSATSALTATIMALDLPKGSFIACPSWSFVATAAAIVAAGHVPYFVDVDEKGFADPSIIDLRVIKAVVLVFPFGILFPGDIKKIDDCGIPFIIDAAAGFDTFSTICKPSRVPVVISTHCTKPFGTGEGGFITCHDEPLLKKIRHILNFGIESHTNVPYIGFNGKMSEYHAAVGLAELDGWLDKREKWVQVKQWYGDNSQWASSSYPMKLNVAAAPIIEALQVKGIQAYAPRYGIHHLKAYRDYPRTELPVTEELMDKTVMLPISVDMTKEEIERVVEELKCASQ